MPAQNGDLATPIYRVCPDCVVRPARVVDPECIVCDGSGKLRLGAGGLDSYEPAVVSEAIEISLAESRETAATLAMLRRSGVLGSRAPRPRAQPRPVSRRQPGARRRATARAALNAATYPQLQLRLELVPAGEFLP